MAFDIQTCARFSPNIEVKCMINMLQQASDQLLKEGYYADYSKLIATLTSYSNSQSHYRDAATVNIENNIQQTLNSAANLIETSKQNRKKAEDKAKADAEAKIKADADAEAKIKADADADAKAAQLKAKEEADAKAKKEAEEKEAANMMEDMDFSFEDDMVSQNQNSGDAKEKEQSSETVGCAGYVHNFENEFIN